MGKCDSCKKDFPEGVAECSLYAGHYKVCKQCILYQKTKVKPTYRCEVSSILQVWCVYCRNATSPGGTIYGKDACERCIQEETRVFTRHMPKVSVDWVDPDPPQPLPTDPPGVHQMKQMQQGMANSLVNTMAAQTVHAIMSGGDPWGGGRRRGKKRR